MENELLIIWDFIFGSLLLLAGIFNPNKILSIIWIIGGILHYVFAIMLISLSKEKSTLKDKK